MLIGGLSLLSARDVETGLTTELTTARISSAVVANRLSTSCHAGLKIVFTVSLHFSLNLFHAAEGDEDDITFSCGGSPLQIRDLEAAEAVGVAQDAKSVPRNRGQSDNVV